MANLVPASSRTHDATADRVVERGVGSRLVELSDGADERRVGLPTDHRQRLDRPACRIRQPADAAVDEAPQRRGWDWRRVVGWTRPVARVGAQQLLHEHRVAGRQGEEPGDKVARRTAAEERRDLLRDLPPIEAAHRHLFEASAVGDRQFVDGRGLVVSRRGKDRERDRARPPGQVVEHGQRRAIGPVDVVDDEERGPADEHVEHGLDELRGAGGLVGVRREAGFAVLRSRSPPLDRPGPRAAPSSMRRPESCPRRP